MNERVIFDAALEIADPQARRAFIEKACSGNPEMLAAVESLLKSHAAAGSFLDIPAAEQMQKERAPKVVAPSHPDESAAAVEKTQTYQPGDADDDDSDDESQTDLSFLQPSSKPGSIGVLAHYEVLSVLGQGAFGIVFKAFDEKLHRLVAIKVMNPQLAATSPPRKRFLREARAAAAIRHENVVQVYSVEEQPLPYLVMEFIDGQTLKQKLDGSGPLETPEVLHISRQIASGLAAAHAMGLIHRDIKPGNILLELGAEQRIKITDFGLARTADDASMTRSGTILGTPMYMAPEQAQGQTLDHRADLFSLGSVLYQMSCGRPPFRAATTVAVLRRVVEDTPRPLPEIWPDIPDWLIAIVTKLHAKKPADRFQSAKEVADLLTRCQSELQLKGEVTCVVVPHDVGHVSNVPAPKPVEAKPITQTVEPSPSHEHVENVLHARRSRPRLIAAAVIVIAVLAGIIIKNKYGDEARKMAAPGRPSDTTSNTKTAEGGHPTKASVTDASTSSTAKPLAPLPPLDLDETDPLPGWELPAGAPPPVVAPCEPTLAKERQQLWAEFLKRPVIEELDVAALALSGMALATGDSGTTSAGKSPAASAVPLTKRSEKNANVSTLKFALIPPGEFRKIFTRPRDPAIELDMPVRRFRLTKPYALSTTEVTWDQFRQFVEATGYQTEAETNGLGGRDREFKPDPKITWRTPGWKPVPNEPVTQVTPRDAEAFCAWLNLDCGDSSPLSLRGGATFSFPKLTVSPKDAQPAKDKKESGDESPHSKCLYRLPTEAEWVHACRAGSVHKHVVGPEPGDLADYAWTQEFLDPTPQASPLHLVAQKKPNPFGLHDTLGNVFEHARDSLSQARMPYIGTNDPMSYGVGTVLGNCWSFPQSWAHPDLSFPGLSIPQPDIGFRVLKQFDGEPLPGPLDRPLVLRPGQPLSVHALVPRPEKIPGLQSWSIELAGSSSPAWFNGIAVSPKDDVIATGNSFGKISLWDRDGNYQRALLGHEGAVGSFDFSPDGRWLASSEMIQGYRGTGGETVRLWSVETGTLHAVIPSSYSSSVRFSPTGEQLAVSSPLMIVNLATGNTLTAGVAAHCVCWSSDGTELACVEGANHLRVRDGKTLNVVRDIEAPVGWTLEWSPDGQWLAMVANDNKVVIRNAKSLNVQTTVKCLGNHFSTRAVAWLPDSRRIAVQPGDGMIAGVFDAATGEELTKFADSVHAHGIAVFDEGKQAVVEAGSRLHFYDTSTGQKLREGKQRGGFGGGTTLGENGAEIFATWYGDVRVFDAATGAERRRLRGVLPDHTFGVRPAPDASSLAAVSWTLPTALILDGQTGAKRHELSDAQGNVTRVVWSPDGKWLATGATDKLVRVWDVASGKIEHELAGHTGAIWSLTWSPDGTRLASAAEDKTVRLWNPRAGKLVATYDQFPEAMYAYVHKYNSLAWTADSRRLWIALSNNIAPLDVETGTFGPLENFSNGNAVHFLNTSPDGQRLLAREDSDWTFVRGRDAQDRRLLGQHLGWTAQWHPDSRRFLGWEYGYGTVGFDVETNRRLGLLFPWLTGDHWLCLGPTGHYRGSPGVEDQIVYVAMLPDGSQRTYTPAEFAKQFAWKNDPEKAELLGK